MFEINQELYTEFIESISLSNEDRESLRTNRGFTDEIIDSLKFRSAGQLASQVLESFGVGRSPAELYACGLWDHETGKPGWQWTTPGKVIIPYLGVDDSVMFLASHKGGDIKGAAPAPYCPKIYGTQHPRIILCEGAFKAAAMYQMGYRALGLGGVSKFAGEHLAKLKMSFGTASHITILFDTEIQDDPTLKSYKENFRKRYAQCIWAYIMAKRIELMYPENSDGFKIKVDIAQLPIEWTIDGKADVDSCVAAGKTREDFDRVLAAAVSPGLFKYNMHVDKKHLPWVNRQLERAHNRSDIIVSGDGCYIIATSKKQKDGSFITGYKEVSNFHIQTRSVVHRHGEITRELQIKSKYGDKSKPFCVTAAELSSPKDFREKCISTGDFLWKGNDSEFQAVIEHIFTDNDMQPIYEVDSCGRDSENKQWIFDNTLIKDSGEVLTADKNGTIWDVECGWRLSKLSSDRAPSISSEEINLDQLLHQFNEAWGINGVMGFCYVVASLFSEYVFNTHRLFPFVWICGERESGKSTLADAMALLSGFPANQTAMNISETTQVAITRKLAYFSSLPVRFDEYRTGDRKIEGKNSMLRSIYNRQGASKGIRTPFGTREVEIKGCGIIIGEEMPEDPAMLSRIIPIFLKNSSKSDKTYAAVRSILEQGHAVSYLTYNILTEYKANEERFAEALKQSQDFISKNTSVSFRAQIHYAMIMAAFNVLFPSIEDSPELAKVVRGYINEILEKCKISGAIYATESTSSRFFRDLLNMKLTHENVDYFAVVEDSEDGKAMFANLSGLYSLWSKYKSSRSRSTMSEQTVKDYVMSQPYCHGNGYRTYFPKIRKTLNAFKFSLNHKDTPQSMKDLAQALEDLIRQETGGLYEDPYD